jgi:hypothetical protein
MMLTDVSSGEGRADTDGTVGCAVPEIVIDAARGLIGVAGREWSRYQAKTRDVYERAGSATWGKEFTFMAEFGRILACTNNSKAR